MTASSLARLAAVAAERRSPLRRLAGDVLQRSRGCSPLADLSTVLIEVPEAAPLLTKSGFPVDSTFPPHLTVLYPFLRAWRLRRPVHDHLAQVCSALGPFRLVFDRVDHFENVTYLAPRSSDQCRAVTDALVDAWPRCKPYRGAFAEVIPHLTVSMGQYDLDEARSKEARLEELLPLEVDVHALAVHVSRSWGWERRWTLPLGAPPRI